MHKFWKPSLLLTIIFLSCCCFISGVQTFATPENSKVKNPNPKTAITDKNQIPSFFTFKKKTYQLKGQMHTHSTTSDGSYSPYALLTKYKQAGYDFVALTDHDIFNPHLEVEGIVSIPGSAELYKGLNHPHFTAYNMKQMRSDIDKPFANVQKTLDSVKKENGLFSIAHPLYPGASITEDEALRLKGYNSIEIYNGYNGDKYTDFIDTLLKDGKRFNLLAVDDFHNETQNIFNTGWIVVNSNSKDWSEILNEVKEGNYYSSNGNDLDLKYKDSEIIATSSEKSNITFVTDSKKVTTTGTTAKYKIAGDELFVRIESIRVRDSKCAWSNPFYLQSKKISLSHDLPQPRLLTVTNKPTINNTKNKTYTVKTKKSPASLTIELNNSKIGGDSVICSFEAKITKMAKKKLKAYIICGTQKQIIPLVQTNKFKTSKQQAQKYQITVTLPIDAKNVTSSITIPSNSNIKIMNWQFSH